MTKPLALSRAGPRRRVPSDGPVDPNNPGSVHTVHLVEAVPRVFMLRAPDGVLGVRRCLPLPPCDTCDASDTLDTLRLKSVLVLNENDVERRVL